MHEVILDGVWSVRQASTPKTALPGQPRERVRLEAVVPGDVMTDLVRAGCIPDPFVGENERCAQWVGECDWVYERRFKAPAGLLREDCVLLRCDGLDTLATVELNGTEVARTENMHRRYAWDVTSLLRPSGNVLRITFRAVTPHTRERNRAEPIRARVGEGHPDAHPAWVRKEACNFGWDWGPILVTCGIWRGIRLSGFSVARLDDLRIEQAHEAGRVDLDIACGVQRAGGREPGRPAPALRARVVLSQDGRVVAEGDAPVRRNGARLTLPVHEPRLWWPNGMGGQPLYTLAVELLDGQDEVLDSLQRRIGLRTLRLDRQEDEWGESFRFVVNDVPFFAKGANWIPVDALLGRRTPERYRALLADSAAANMNMVRVWGGGIYEDDVFYDLCDELGLCVWQDFLFACMAYPSWDKAFMKNVEAEARDNVRRLRHHACLALWCGNNELEEQGVTRAPNPGRTTRGAKRAGDAPARMTWEEYGALFDKLLADVVRELAPATDYWPASPHSPRGDRADFNNPACGDAHLWGVWHGRKPFEWFRTCTHRFNSEFGFQSFPEPRTVRGYTQPRDRNVTSPVMEHHQRSGIGNTVILQYMLDWFRMPSSFDMTLWASQILQGMAITYAVEHWRRSMPRGMGTLYWQLNDVWPVASWASIDFHGRWKALHYMARRFFAPVLVSGVEDRARGAVEVHVTSDRLNTRSGTLRWTATDAAGAPLRSGFKRLRTPVNGSRLAATLRLKDLLDARTERDLLVWLELDVDGEPPSTSLVLFGRPKQLQLSDSPGITTAVTAQGDGSFRVALKARRAALWTWLELEGLDARWSDNFIHLRPDGAVELIVTPESPMTAAQLADKLLVRSLADTHQHAVQPV